MRKLYAMLVLLCALMAAGAPPAMAQDDIITVEVNSKTGDWTAANSNKTWASRWESYGTPSLVIEHTNASGGHNNNMAYYAPNKTDIQFYNSLGGSTTQENYYLRFTDDYIITEVSFDFVCSNDQGVSINLNNADLQECTSQTEPVHVEATDLDMDEVFFTVATISGGTTFANTSNFIVKARKKSEIDVAWDQLTTTVEKYMVYYAENIEDSYFKIGTEPGLYGEAEVTAFYEALKKGIEGKVEGATDAETIEALNKLNQDIIDTYEAVLASKVMAYPVADGFYRLRTALTYTNDDDGTLVKYMMGYKTQGILTAIWGTPEDGDVTDQAMALWKITNKDGLFDVQNMFHDGRFNNVVRSTTVTMTADSENLLAFDPVTTEEGVTIINARVASQNADDGIYLHQNGHASGAGKNGYIVGYYTSYNYATAAPGGSEWILEPVGEEEAAKIIADYAPIKQRQAFEQAYATLKTDATAALEKAKDYILTALITSTEQFSSPWTETREGSIDNLIDGNASTYWHSDWSTTVENHTHYLQVALNEPTHELVRLTISRRPVANDHITLWGVYGSNEPDNADEDWVELASLATPFGSNTETISTELFDTKGYTHLRFYIDNTTGTNGSNSRGYGHVSEFQLYEAKVNPTSQYALMGQTSKELERVLNEQKDKEIADVQQADYDALKAVYDAFVAQYVDPAELRAVLAQAEALAGGIVIGTQPGYWQNADVATQLKNTVAEAKAYDEAGAYVAAKSSEFIQKLKQQSEEIRGAAIGVQTGKWYRIHFGAEADFEKYGWDLVAGEAVINGDEVETDEALWDKYITAALSVTTDGIHYVEPNYAEDIRLTSGLYFDADADIEEKDLSMFRFVEVGDTAFVLQNKGTGLFLHAAGTSGAVTLSLHPTLFSVGAIGYGQNVIAAKSLEGEVQNYLHAQRSYNMLVTWDANTPGSRSALYIEEAGDVEAAYAGTDVSVDIRKGQVYSFCYPVNLSVGEGQMYDVQGFTDKSLSLVPVKEAAAGRPFLYIYGETGEYDAEGETDVLTFRHGYDFVAAPLEATFLKGTFAARDLGSGIIVPEANGFVVTNFMSGNVAAYTAYATTEETVTTADDITFVIEADATDGIQAALQNVSRRGAIYTIDGRLVTNSGTLNDLRSLGRGAYIVNGTKVLVK